MARIITKGLLGKEDISIGTNTFTRATSTGGTQILHQVNWANLNGFPAMLYVDGVTYTTVQAAINALPSTGGWVLIPPGTYVGPTTIPSHVHLLGFVSGLPAATIAAANAVLVWGTPPADQKIIFTYTTNLTLSGLWDTTIEGITFDFGGNNAGIVLQNGVFECHFGTPAAKIVIQNCGSGTALTLSGGSVAGQSIVGNDFDISIFNVGKGIVLTATNPGVAANNRFHTIHIHNVSVRAIDFVQQADSNRFDWTFVSGLANTAGCIVFNSGTPGSDTNVLDNVFTHALCADVTNPGSYSGTLVTVNKCTHPNALMDWEIGPGIQSGGGVELSNTTSSPFLFNITSDLTASVNDGALSVGVIRSYANNATMGMTLKKGSGAGNYTSASLTYAQVDATNLLLAVTIPTGWKLGIVATGEIGSNTAVVAVSVALADGGVVLQEMTTTGVGIGTTNPFTLAWVVTGDGLSHSIDLRYKTSNASDAAVISNPSATLTPSIIFTLMPSN